jgi:hypothetical protein
MTFSIMRGPGQVEFTLSGLLSKASSNQLLATLEEWNSHLARRGPALSLTQ